MSQFQTAVPAIYDTYVCLHTDTDKYVSKSETAVPAAKLVCRHTCICLSHLSPVAGYYSGHFALKQMIEFNQ